METTAAYSYCLITKSIVFVSLGTGHLYEFVTLISLQRSALMRETRGDCHSRMRIGRNCSIISFVLVLIDYCEVGIQKQIVRSFKVVY